MDTFAPKSGDGVRAACKRCGYAGHLTFQCRNFIKADPNKEVLLDVSSTSSDSSDVDFVSPLTQLKKGRRTLLLDFIKAALMSRSRSPVKKKKSKKHKKNWSDSESDSKSDISESSHKKKYRKSKKKHKHRDSDSSDSEDQSDNRSRRKHKKKSKKHKKHQDSSKSDSDSGKGGRGKYSSSKYYVSYKEMM
uniref:Protein SREK1IP1 n=1 Tax=Magallana gigas TaxID=29159 RepID=K1QUX0_MAGGI